MIAYTIGDEKFAKEFSALAAQMKKPRALLAGVGREARNLLVSHFRARDRNEPNKLGGKRTHYWNGVADSVLAPVVEESGSNGMQARISIDHPTFGAKLRDQRIVPKNVENLTVPQTAEAYGRTAETFEAETGLKLFIFKKKGDKATGDRGFAALAAKFASGGIVIEYILRKFVDQKKDDDALPDMREGSPFIKALLARGETIVKRQIAEPGGATTA